MDTQEYRKLFQEAPVACLVTDDEGRIHEANEEAARLLGVPCQALAGSFFASFMALGEHRAVRRTAERLMRPDGEQRAKWVTILQPRGRAPFPAMVTVAPSASATGPRLCWLMCDIAICTKAPAVPSTLPDQPEIPVQLQRIAAQAQATALGTAIARHQRTAEALRQAQQFTREIIDGVAMGIIVYDNELRYVLWNRFMEELTGMPAERVIGRCAPELFNDIRNLGPDRLLQRALKGEVFSTPDVQFEIPQTGRKRWVSVRYAPQRDCDGVIVGVIAMVSDVTARRNAEMALRNSLQRYRSLKDMVPVGIFLTDARGVGQFANEFACRIVGMTPEEVMAGGWTQRLHPDDRERVLAAWQQARDKVEVLESEHRFVHPDGTVTWALVRAVPELGDDGELRGFLGTITDITEHKRSEEALRQSEQRYRHLVEHARDIIFETDARGNFTYVNGDVVRQILGYEADEVTGMNCLALVRPDFRDAVAQFYHTQFLERIENTYLEFPALAKNGRQIWFGQHAQMVMEADRLVGFRAICRDITEQKQAETELQKTSDRLRRLAAHLESVREEENRKIAAEVHDSLGGNLNMIKLGLASYIETLTTDDPVRERLDSVLALCEDAIRIARGITASLRPRMLDTLGLVATIRWYAGEFMRMTGLRCAVRAPEYIRLAPERTTAVFRIIQEALTNVARHAAATAVVIDVVKSQTHLAVTIADDGRGIGSADSDKQNSYGILSMNERSQYLGGHLEIEGTPGHGTVVKLRVPFEN
jgi:PAS domain S-box-containing protein